MVQSYVRKRAGLLLHKANPQQSLKTLSACYAAIAPLILTIGLGCCNPRESSGPGAARWFAAGKTPAHAAPGRCGRDCSRCCASNFGVWCFSFRTYALRTPSQPRSGVVLAVTARMAILSCEAAAPRSTESGREVPPLRRLDCVFNRKTTNTTPLRAWDRIAGVRKSQAHFPFPARFCVKKQPKNANPEIRNKKPETRNHNQTA